MPIFRTLPELSRRRTSYLNGAQKSLGDGIHGVRGGGRVVDGILLDGHRNVDGGVGVPLERSVGFEAVAHGRRHAHAHAHRHVHGHVDAHRREDSGGHGHRGAHGRNMAVIKVAAVAARCRRVAGRRVAVGGHFAGRRVERIGERVVRGGAVEAALIGGHGRALSGRRHGRRERRQRPQRRLLRLLLVRRRAVALVQRRVAQVVALAQRVTHILMLAIPFINKKGKFNVTDTQMSRSKSDTYL